MLKLWEGNIELEKPIIQCEGTLFYSVNDAAAHFKLSDERIRQKLRDGYYVDYIYLY